MPNHPDKAFLRDFLSQQNILRASRAEGAGRAGRAEDASKLQKKQTFHAEDTQNTGVTFCALDVLCSFWRGQFLQASLFHTQPQGLCYRITSFPLKHEVSGVLWLKT